MNADLPEKLRLLVLDDQPAARRVLTAQLQAFGYEVTEAGDEDHALEVAQRQACQVAVVSCDGQSSPNLELVQRLRSQAGSQVIVLGSDPSVAQAVAAMKSGACDYLANPVTPRRLQDAVTRAVTRSAPPPSCRQDISNLGAGPVQTLPDHGLLGQSVGMREVYRLIERVGPTNQPVLIQGESGTGKELVAHALHRTSHRAERPLVIVNCAALPESLLESELFGHERGAFTGAAAAKPGLFEVADRGTLFIDEIGELAGGLQAKLLRVLEDGLVRRVGGIQSRRVDVRVLTATHRDLQQQIAQGLFREDLYYRIDVMRLQLPPLRDRREDIPLLARHFAGAGWTIEPDALEALIRYDWPGNVRQLINAIERARILADDRAILLRNLPTQVGPECPPPANSLSETGNLEDARIRHIAAILQRERGNKVKAARALGVSRRRLYRLLAKYDLGTVRTGSTGRTGS